MREELAALRLNSEKYRAQKTCEDGAELESFFKAPIIFLFTFNGTIGRRAYALSQLVIIAIYFILYSIALVTGLDIFFIICFIFAVIGCFSSLSLGVRRCRDVGKKWYWLLIPYYGIVLLFEKREQNTVGGKRVENEL